MPPAVRIEPSPAKFRARANHNINARLNIWVARFAQLNSTIFDGDIGFDDAPVIQHNRIGDHFQPARFGTDVGFVLVHHG